MTTSLWGTPGVEFEGSVHVFRQLMARSLDAPPIREITATMNGLVVHCKLSKEVRASPYTAPGRGRSGRNRARY